MSINKIKAPGSIFVELGQRLQGRVSEETMFIIMQWCEDFFDSDNSVLHIVIKNGKITKVEDLP